MSTSKDTRIEIRNQTPHPLRVEVAFTKTKAAATEQSSESVSASKSPLTEARTLAQKVIYELAPLANKSLHLAAPSDETIDLRQQLSGLHNLNVISVIPEAEAINSDAFAGLIFPVGFVLAMAWVFLKDKFAWQDPWIVLTSVLAIVAIGAGFAYFMRPNPVWTFFRLFWILLIRVFTLCLVLGIAVVLPAMTLLLLAPDKILPERMNSAFLLLSSGGVTGLAHAVVFAFVCFASVLPALLYFLFNRKRVRQLRDTFEQQIFRLDPQVKNLADVQARYGARLDGVWGDTSSGFTGQASSGSQWPVVLCTLAYAGAWSVIVLFGAIQNEYKAFTDLSNLLAAPNTTYAFGFFGAYYFAINMIVRRYIRGDLQPKTYSIITARLLVVLVSAAVLSAAPDSGWVVWIFMFLIGVVPETFIVYLRETVVAPVFTSKRIPIDRLPLTRLEGIDLYDRARLEEEGIGNLDNLAHADLVDLMINTSIPSAQLVEWLDQAALYLRAHTLALDAAATAATREIPTPGLKGPDPDLLWHELRDMGIRRASDLFVDVKNELRPQLIELAKAQGKGDAFVARLNVLANQLTKDESFANIRSWRANEERELQTWRVDSEGNANLAVAPAAAI